MAEKVSLKPPPTGNEVLLKAFEESKGKTVDVVVDQEVAGVTPEMFNWWMTSAILPYYRLWWPEMHFAAEMVMPPDGGEPRVIIKEMITPYYTEFHCGLIQGGISFLAPDDKKMGQLIHTPTASPNGMKLHSVFTFPATTPKSFLDAMYTHCKGEMQDLPRFLPELYKQKAGTPPPTGNEVLLKAFEESEGKTVDFVDTVEIAGVTPEMFHWWTMNIPPYYRLWWPQMHFVEERWMTPEGKIHGIIKEMFWPYYTELSIAITPEGVIHILAPDGEIMGQISDTVTPTPKGMILRGVHTLPAKTPQSFIDAIREHFKGEMQDLPRFLPELYKQKAGK